MQYAKHIIVTSSKHSMMICQRLSLVKDSFVKACSVWFNLRKMRIHLLLLHETVLVTQSKCSTLLTSDLPSMHTTHTFNTLDFWV